MTVYVESLLASDRELLLNMTKTIASPKNALQKRDEGSLSSEGKGLSFMNSKSIQIIEAQRRKAERKMYEKVHGRLPIKHK